MEQMRRATAAAAIARVLIARASAGRRGVRDGACGVISPPPVGLVAKTRAGRPGFRPSSSQKGLRAKGSGLKGSGLGANRLVNDLGQLPTSNSKSPDRFAGAWELGLGVTHLELAVVIV